MGAALVCPELTPGLPIRGGAWAQAFSDLLGLLMHENTDIAGDVLELLKELTDGDVVQDSVRTPRPTLPLQLLCPCPALAPAPTC